MTDADSSSHRDLVLRRRCARLLPADESVRTAFLVADQPMTMPGFPLTHYRIVCVTDRAVVLLRPSVWWNFWPRRVMSRHPRGPLWASTYPPKGMPGSVQFDRRYYVHGGSLPELRRAVADLGAVE